MEDNRKRHMGDGTVERQSVLYGNAVVGQSGGPTAAINATLAGVIRGVAELRRGRGDCPIRRLFGMRNGVDGLLRGDLLDLDALFEPSITGSDRNLETLTLTPSSALGSCRRRLPSPGTPEEDAVMGQLLRILKERDIRYFFYIGGNDSMDTAAKLAAYAGIHGYEMRVIGVPKTIDNDLEKTDHTPGYGSAAKYIAVTVQEILRDTAVYTIPAVTIVEIMGRGAGWLAAAASLGRHVTGEEPDFVYLPEHPFCPESFFEDISSALKKHPNVVVAVSEGLKNADGQYIRVSPQSGSADAFGHRDLAGTGKALELAVRERFGCKVRSVELNLPQRCAAHLASAQDIDESLAVGSAAVRAAVAGISRVMMTIRRTSDRPYAYTVGHADIAAVANRVRTVPKEYIDVRGNRVTDACLDYILPLIRGERYPAYRDGLPQHLIL